MGELFIWLRAFNSCEWKNSGNLGINFVSRQLCSELGVYACMLVAISVPRILWPDKENTVLKELHFWFLCSKL